MEVGTEPKGASDFKSTSLANSEPVTKKTPDFPFLESSQAFQLTMKNDYNENSLLTQLSGAAKQQPHPRGTTFYLAGKIRKNDWRHRLVPGLRHSPWDGPVTETPILENGIAPGLNYSGPWFVGCDHGCFHGEGTHGAIDDGANCGSGSPPAIPYEKRHLVAFAALWQINRSNIIFAWIESADAFGTLVEIGVATGLKKTIWLGGPERIPEHWFSHCFVDYISFDYADPAEFLAACLSDRFGAPHRAENGRLCPPDAAAILQS